MLGRIAIVAAVCQASSPKNMPKTQLACCLPYCVSRQRIHFRCTNE